MSIGTMHRKNSNKGDWLSVGECMRKDLQREDFTSQAIEELIVVHQGRRWEGAL